MRQVLFCFRGSWRNIIEKFPMEAGRRLLYCIISYGATGTFQACQPNEEALMAAIAPMIDTMNRRHQACVTNGKLGGRPCNMAVRIFVCTAFNNNIPIEKIADTYSISTRTVYRHIQWGIDQHLFAPYTLDSYIYEALFKKIKNHNPNDKRLKGSKNKGQAVSYQQGRNSISGQAGNNLAPM